MPWGFLEQDEDKQMAEYGLTCALQRCFDLGASVQEIEKHAAELWKTRQTVENKIRIFCALRGQ